MVDSAVRACLGPAPRGVANYPKWKSLPKVVARAVRRPDAAYARSGGTPPPPTCPRQSAPVKEHDVWTAPSHVESFDTTETL